MQCIQYGTLGNSKNNQKPSGKYRNNEEKRGLRKYDFNMFISMHPRKHTEVSKL